MYIQNGYVSDFAYPPLITFPNCPTKVRELTYLTLCIDKKGYSKEVSRRTHLQFFDTLTNSWYYLTPTTETEVKYV